MPVLPPLVFAAVAIPLAWGGVLRGRRQEEPTGWRLVRGTLAVVVGLGAACVAARFGPRGLSGTWGTVALVLPAVAGALANLLLGRGSVPGERRLLLGVALAMLLGSALRGIGWPPPGSVLSGLPKVLAFLALAGQAHLAASRARTSLRLQAGWFWALPALGVLPVLMEGVRCEGVPLLAPFVLRTPAWEVGVGQRMQGRWEWTRAGGLVLDDVARQLLSLGPGRVSLRDLLRHFLRRDHPHLRSLVRGHVALGVSMPLHRRRPDGWLQQVEVSVERRRESRHGTLELRGLLRVSQVLPPHDLPRDLWGAVLAASPDCVYVYDLEQRRALFVSDESRSLLGYTPVEIQELGPGGLLSLVDPRERASFAQHHRALPTSSGPPGREIEVRMRHREGPLRTLALRTKIVSGEAVAHRELVVGILRDVTDLRAAQAALIRSERRLRDLVKAAPFGLFAVDQDNLILFANEEAERILAYEAGGLAGHSLLELLPEEAHELTAAGAEAFRAGLLGPGRLRDLETQGLTRRGERVDLALGFSLVEGEDGPTVLVALQDVSERKRLEKERRDLERHAREAGKLEAVGHLAGGIAHDFNNVLTGIMGYAELARGASLSGHPALRELEAIRSAASRAAGLTRQLLAFSKRQVLEPKVFCLGCVVGELQGLLEHLLGERVRPEWSRPEQHVHVLADRSQIEQIVLNLCVNARDAMPDGGRLRVGVHAEQIATLASGMPDIVPPGDYAVLEVDDEGTGIAPAILPRIFEPFFTTKSGDGTGLGLSTVHGIVHQSQGYLSVQSVVGRGTLFRVFLPLVETPEPLAPTAEAPVVSPAPVAEGPRTVLLVEDDASVRRVTRLILEGAGYLVLEAPSAEVAEQVIARRRARIDLVLSDVVLPGRSGVDLYRAIRAETRTVPVLLMSGYPLSAPELLGEAEGECEWMAKPLSPQALLEKVAALLAQSSPEWR